jgi:hypothetical protein
MLLAEEMVGLEGEQQGRHQRRAVETPEAAQGQQRRQRRQGERQQEVEVQRQREIAGARR